MMKMSKKMKVVFCLLISMFLVTQLLAVEQYLLICTDKGIRIYLVPDKDKMKKNWGDPVLTLEEGKCVTSAGFNTDSTTLYALLGESTKFIFYKITRGGSLKDIDKIKFNGIPAERLEFCGFNPIDGTFYICNHVGKDTKFEVFDVKDDAVHFKYKVNGLRPKEIVFNTKDPYTINGGGFDPSGEVFFLNAVGIRKNSTFHFYKIQKGEDEEVIDLGSVMFPPSAAMGPVRGGFLLDSSHFYVCNKGVGINIYKFTLPCDQWTENSVSEISFTKIKTLSSDVKGYNAVVFNPTPEKVTQFSDKALRRFRDVNIHTH
jgi:hypothetical protein